MLFDYVPPMPAARPLIVRLRNWVGDVTLGLPLLQRLADAGYALQLVGKPWAHDLLAGHGWPVHVQPVSLHERVALLRRLKQQAQFADPARARRLNALCLPYSFSSALEFRLAGLRALGWAHEGRSPLLARALPRPQGLHALQEYWALGDALLGQTALAPAAIGLRVSTEHQSRARELMAAQRIAAGGIVICPFASHTPAQQNKAWPAFAAFAAQELPRFGRTVLLCPGPGEEAAAREHFAGVRLLPGVDLGTYAALLQQAALMLSNDTGPGHMAAALGTPLVSVLGPTDAARWRAWGPRVHLVQSVGWPDAVQVRAAVARALAGA